MTSMEGLFSKDPAEVKATMTQMRADTEAFTQGYGSAIGLLEHETKVCVDQLRYGEPEDRFALAATADAYKKAVRLLREQAERLGLNVTAPS